MSDPKDGDYGPGMVHGSYKGGDGTDHGDLEQMFGNPNAASHATELDPSTNEGREALGNLMWEEAQRQYDFSGFSEEQIAAVAKHTTATRGYSREDLLDDDIRREHITVTAAQLGARRRQAENTDEGRTSGLGWTGTRGRGASRSDAGPEYSNDPDERNRGWLQSMAESRAKAGIR